jgi:Tol biopolymer transport system component
VPLAGGTPREIAEDIRFAEWGPDGAQAIVFRGDQLQYPVGGRVLHRGEGIHPRLSPAGDRLAYSDRNQVHVLDLAGRELLASKRVEDQGRFAVRSLAWSASGDEVLFTVGGGAQTKLVAMDRKGRERPLMTQPRGMAIYDVSRDGRVLLNVERGRREVWVGSTGEIRERNLSVFATANAMGISADGTQLLDNEDTGYYLLRTDGTPPKKLGNDAFATELSADGKWAVVVRKGPPMQLVLVPTGSGQERVLERGPIDEYEPTNVRWSQDGRVLLFGAREKGKEAGRFWIQDVRQGPPRPLAPEGVGIGWSSISADGRFVVIEAADGHWIYPTDGGERKAVSGFLKTDFAWRNTSPDGRYLYAWDLERLPFEVSRVDLQTGKREPWKTIAPQDPSGITLADLMITPDGKSYAYNCTRQLSDLFLVTGVH